MIQLGFEYESSHIILRERERERSSSITHMIETFKIAMWLTVYIERAMSNAEFSFVI